MYVAIFDVMLSRLLISIAVLAFSANAQAEHVTNLRSLPGAVADAILHHPHPLYRVLGRYEVFQSPSKALDVAKTPDDLTGSTILHLLANPGYDLPGVHVLNQSRTKLTLFLTGAPVSFLAELAFPYEVGIELSDEQYLALGKRVVKAERKVPVEVRNAFTRLDIHKKLTSLDQVLGYILLGIELDSKFEPEVGMQQHMLARFREGTFFEHYYNVTSLMKCFSPAIRMVLAGVYLESTGLPALDVLRPEYLDGLFQNGQVYAIERAEFMALVWSFRSLLSTVAETHMDGTRTQFVPRANALTHADARRLYAYGSALLHLSQTAQPRPQSASPLERNYGVHLLEMHQFIEALRQKLAAS